MGYGKALLVFHMLRRELGDEAFTDGLRRFYRENRFRFASYADLRSAFEAASGRDLKAFFQGWFYEWELPDVRTSWTETPVEGGVRVDLRVTQHKGPFVFPLWVEWMEGGAVRREMVVATEASQEFTLRVAGKPERVRINPDHLVPGKFS